MLWALQMAVEVNDADGTVFTVDAAQQRQGDGVVTAEGDDTRKRLALLGQTLHVRVGGRRTREDAVVALLDLLDGPGVVVPASPLSEPRKYVSSMRLLTKSQGCLRSQ